MNYGLIGGQQRLQELSDIVCDCLGHGSNNTASKLIFETAMAETGGGSIKDNTLNAGMGITQFDEIPFYDVKNRSTKYHGKIDNCFGIVIELVKWEDLRYNPLLALIFTRLKYIIISESIPLLKLQRASYWKKYYNSVLGKGTIKHYMEMNK